MNGAADPTTRVRVPLGAECGADRTRFAVFAHAQSVRIRLVHPGTRELRVLEMSPLDAEPGVWTAELEGNWHGWAYTYELERDGRTLSGIMDPWAKIVYRGEGYLGFDRTPVSPRPALSPSDVVLYELHLRDFTRDPASGVEWAFRGGYLGLAQRGTRLVGHRDCATGLDHILELGVNVVQLMPVHSFALPHNPTYEWGYMPNDFNAPHPGYASAVDPEAPMRETKQLVSALHSAGLRVTLDVVYNHTAERWPRQLRSFMALAPHEYFRFKDDGSPWDGSLCGNEFRSESEQGRRFIVESCRYWVEEYGVDGFRFDLLGLIDRETMELVARELHAIDPTLLVYGEPWAAGPTPIEVTGKGAQRGRGWGVFNDEMRDSLRGSVFDVEDMGFLNAGQDIEGVKRGIVGGTSTFAEHAQECVNYVECHDNHTLMDRLALAPMPGPASTEEDRIKMNLLGALILMTSQGIPFIHSGQEFGRSKEGAENSYNLGDQINNIRWMDKCQRERLFRYYRDAIAMRREHPMFRLSGRAEIERSVRFLDDHLGLALPAGTIGYRLEDGTGRDSWRSAVLLFNGTGEDAVMPLPEGRWRIAADDGAFEDGTREAEGEMRVESHCGAVLYASRSG